MHDDEPDTFVLQTLPEQFVEKLSKIGIKSKANEIGEGQFETGDYYSRVFVPTPRMVTNRGSLEISGKNIAQFTLSKKDKILMQDPTPMVCLGQWKNWHKGRLYRKQCRCLRTGDVFSTYEYG